MRARATRHRRVADAHGPRRPSRRDVGDRCRPGLPACSGLDPRPRAHAHRPQRRQLRPASSRRPGAARSSPSTPAVSRAATPTSRLARPATGPPSSPTCGSSAAARGGVRHPGALGPGDDELAGESVPHADLPFRRLREVLVHHADLGDDGFTPAEWPADYVREELRRMEMLYNARQPMGVTGLPEAARAAAPLASGCAGCSAVVTSRGWSQRQSSSGHSACLVAVRTLASGILPMNRRPPRTGRQGARAGGRGGRRLGVRGRRRRR